MSRSATPDAPATLAALVHARDALDGGKRPDADTCLVLSLLLLKVASDATYYGNPAIAYSPGEPPRCVPYSVPLGHASTLCSDSVMRKATA